MKILVATASRHGSTFEIGIRIRDRLRATGLEVDARPAGEIHSIDAYSAVIIGSAVYAGAWLKPARILIERQADALRNRTVWLFSSGPVGEIKGKPVNEDQVRDLMDRSGAEAHVVFSGKLDRAGLSRVERGIVRLLKVPDGDFRDWEAIDVWAAEIAGHLVPVF